MCYTTKAKKMRPYRLAVRTAPSHGANSGSSPDKVTKKKKTALVAVFFFLANLFKIRRARRVRARSNKIATTLSERSPLAEHRRYPYEPQKTEHKY